MSGMPDVSIIVPAFNAERYVQQCISSLLAQGDVPLEILVVDDGSTDRTAELVQDLGSPVRYLHQANAGSAVARNHGVEASYGRYIAFCDSDDLWVPHRLQQQIEFLRKHPEYGAACGRFELIDAEASFDPSANPPLEGQATIDPSQSGWMYLTLLRDSVFHLDTLLMTRDVAQRVHFDRRYRRGQDFDFFLQLSQTTRIAQIDAVYAYYRQHPESITRRPHLRNYRAEVTEAAVARWGTSDADGHRMTDAELRLLLAKSWFSHGWDLYHAAWYVKAGEAFRRCLALQPLHPGALRYAALSWLRRRQDCMPPDAKPV